MRTRAPQPVVWEGIGILARYPFRRAWLPALLEGIMNDLHRWSSTRPGGHPGPPWAGALRVLALPPVVVRSVPFPDLEPRGCRNRIGCAPGPRAGHAAPGHRWPRTSPAGGRGRRGPFRGVSDRHMSRSDTLTARNPHSAWRIRLLHPSVVALEESLAKLRYTCSRIEALPRDHFMRSASVLHPVSPFARTSPIAPSTARAREARGFLQTRV